MNHPAPSPGDTTRRRPTIVVTAARGWLNSDAGKARAHWASDALLHAIITAGGVPVISVVGLPERTCTTLVSRADALVLTGGEDIGSYGRPYRVGRTDPDRDRSERDLLHAARQRGLPILGICRGMQLLAVTSGGRLRAVPGHCDPKIQPLKQHRITWDDKSPVVGRALHGVTRVNSLHNYAVIDSGDFRPVAWAEDGTIEAIERTSAWEVGVQWHPELPPTGSSASLWTALIHAARSRRSHLDGTAR